MAYEDVTMTTSARAIPLNFFGIPFGLLGLADCWLVSAAFGLTPVLIGRLLVAVAVLAWVVVGSAHLRGMRAHHVTLGDDLSDPITGPFASLAVIVPMLSAADALYPLNHTAGTVAVDVFILVTVILAGWFTGQWIYRPLELAKVHPGYFLPSVAGGLVASASAGLVDQLRLAQVLFGLGLVCWIVLGSIILGRLMLGPALPGPLTPTIAIEIAPAAVATFAAFVIDGHHVDTLVRVLAGYGLLMVIAQFRLLPAYRRLSFTASFWAFTFSWAAVTFAGLFWLGVTHPAGWRAESYVALAIVSGFIAAIAVRTVIALQRAQLIPISPQLASNHSVPGTPIDSDASAGN
jgi:tellurite resistance protein